MDRSTFWWCFVIREGKGILGMFTWRSRILLIDLPCMMGIWGQYMAFALLMLSVVIGQFLIWSFWTASIKVCVDGHPTSYCIIITLSAPLIYHL